MNIFNFMWTNRSEVFALTLEHLVIVGVSILIAAAIGLPLGILMTRWSYTPCFPLSETRSLEFRVWIQPFERQAGEWE